MNCDNVAFKLPIIIYNVNFFTAIREISNPDITVPQPDDIHSNILLIHLNSGRITSQDFLQHLHTVR